VEHDHVLLDSSKDNAALSIMCHSTNNSILVPIEKFSAVALPTTTGLDTDSIWCIPSRYYGGVAFRFKYLGIAAEHIAVPSGTDSQGQISLFGHVKILCHGQVSTLDWLIPSSEKAGYMVKATAGDLTNTWGRSVVAYEALATGSGEIYCLQLPWRVG
jgi:hypothetical protein